MSEADIFKALALERGILDPEGRHSQFAYMALCQPSNIDIINQACFTIGMSEHAPQPETINLVQNPNGVWIPPLEHRADVDAQFQAQQETQQRTWQAEQDARSARQAPLYEEAVLVARYGNQRAKEIMAERARAAVTEAHETAASHPGNPENAFRMPTAPGVSAPQFNPNAGSIMPKATGNGSVDLNKLADRAERFASTIAQRTGLAWLARKVGQGIYWLGKSRQF